MQTRENLLTYLAAVFLFFLGIGLRLLYLNNPPLDFIQARQLRSAIIARGMYCALAPCADETRRQTAIAMWQGEDVYEPQINERLAATLYYLLGGEKPWVFRFLAASYWAIGALAIFMMTSRWLSLKPALVALAFYAVPVFQVVNGRSYQPEPFMVMWIILAVFFLERWVTTQSWRHALLAGVLGGVAILVKIMAVFPVAAVFGLLASGKLGWKRLFSSKQVWCIGILLMVIPASYYGVMIGSRSSGFFSFWTLAMLHKIIEPAFYVRWFSWLHDLVGLLPIALAVYGSLYLPPQARRVVGGWFAGYVVYTAFLPAQVSTHTYYNLILIPGVAMGLAGMAAPFFQKIVSQPPLYRLAFWGIATLAVLFPAWITRSVIVSQNEGIAQEVKGWQRLCDELPRDGKMIGLTHDYGNRIRYLGWRYIASWPYSWDFDLNAEVFGAQESFEEQFKEKTEGFRYFVVTDFTDLEAQPALKNYLYQNFPIAQSDDGYVVFDLAQRLEAAP